jgi:hypothetical protein
MSNKNKSLFKYNLDLYLIKKNVINMKNVFINIFEFWKHIILL